MKNLIFASAFILTLTSCVNFSNIQSAKTLGPNRKVDHYVYSRVTVPVVQSEVEGVLPNLEYVFKHRIKDRLDWGLKAGIFDASLTGNIKYQFVGTYNSKFAMSIMPEAGLGFFPVDASASDNVHSVPLVIRSEFPLLMTYHFTEHFYWSVIPKALNYYTPQGNFTMMAASTGVQFGKKVNMILSYSYFNLLNKPSNVILSGNVGHVFEIGLKFNMFTGKVFAPRFSND